MKDNIFDYPGAHGLETFEFSEDVARVFDDMVSRSVPAYWLLQSALAELAIQFSGSGRVYDLGCSTGNTLQTLIERSPKPLELVGVDSAPAMLDLCRSKLEPKIGSHRLLLEQADLTSLDALPYGPGSVVILCLVAQFLRPFARAKLIKLIHQELQPGGALLLVEKTVQPHKLINAAYIDGYYAFKKKNGYNETEIARKREALENVLIPLRPEENVEMLRAAGFDAISVFFTWLNFQGYLAVRSPW